jgi:Starch-binding associating with outer membrane
MKILKLYIIGSALGGLLLFASACKKNFGEINTNPSVVITPDVGFLFTYAEEKMMTYQYNEWIWESMEQLLRFTQHITTDPYELTSNVNGRYGAFYNDVLPNLTEIRRQASLKADSANYQKIAAQTYVLQVMLALKVTDMNGSIPYTEASQARAGGKFDPVYNPQAQLLDVFIEQLDNSISVLSDASLTNQVSFGNADTYYKGDYTKWIMLANSLKLRIAARLELQDNAKAQQLFQQVMQDATGPITSEEDQLTFQSIDYLAFGQGGEIDYRSTRYATTSIVNFMKKGNDPRLPIYFAPNGLKSGFADTLAKYSTSLPAFIDPNDPLIQYQGGPADGTTNTTVAGFIKNPFPVGNTSPGNSVTNYFLISTVNKFFFSPKFNNPGGGQYKEVSLTAAETCLQIAEFIEKGYAGAVDTKGTAEDWYRKGVTASIKTMNGIAIVAQSTTGLAGDGTAEIDAYLADPDIAFDGSNDLERIYIQQYLNLFRNPNEAYVLCRRTGFPKYGSAYYARETFNDPIPRRFWTLDPGETNRANWEAAMTDQGFTPNAQDVQSLSTQRVWYDKPAPDFGGGN